MIPIDVLPDLDWSDIASQEISRAGPIIENSQVAYRIANIAVAGLIYPTLIGPPWFWFALAKGITLRELLDFRRIQERIPKGSLTMVNKEQQESFRFAKLYGFEETGESLQQDEIEYLLMRKV